jgi:hypothetical protein
VAYCPFGRHLGANFSLHRQEQWRVSVRNYGRTFEKVSEIRVGFALGGSLVNPVQVLLQNGVERATEVDTRAWMYFIRLSGGPMECCAANLKSRAGTGATLVGLAASPARTLLCQRGI